jgi:hypothetical protein
MTIKDIHIGTRFCQPEYLPPFNETMAIVDIEYNPNAGKPIKDMFGAVVWEEPFATIKAKGEITSRIEKYSVQTDKSKLDDWLTFI